MQYVIDSKQAKEVDTYTIESIGIPSLVLMERAAMAVVEHIETIAKPGASVLCMCGTGNNGGDGIAIGRILHQKGYKVQIAMLGDEKKCSKDNVKQQNIAKGLGVSFGNKYEDEEYTVIVDAIFGIGITREIRGEFAKAIDWVNEQRAKVVAVDIPSGIHTDTGMVLGVAVRADRTVTFGYKKHGIVFYPGAEYAGDVIVADIGFSRDLEKEYKNYYYEKEDLRKQLPRRKAYSNKGSYGKVLVIAGNANMAGACYLAAHAAYATGAGLVKVITATTNRSVIQQLLPEAVMHCYEDGNFCEADYIQDIKDAKAIVIGPGIGRGEEAEKLLNLVLVRSRVPVVLDADALQLMAKKRKSVEAYSNGEMKCKLEERFILTPHLKEMVDLMGENVSIKSLQCREIDMRRVWGRNLATLVLKDARTLVMQGEKCYINDSGNSGMATAGSGDVLTGIILGLLAQGMKPYEAAAMGVYLHGLAGDVAASNKNEYSMTARDMISALANVLKAAEIE